MAHRTLANLGLMVRERRGARKLREVAGEIGVSAATLMRVENGRTPDVSTFGKLCQWLGVDPGTMLGYRTDADEPSDSGPGLVLASAHLRADRTPQPATVSALARMILLAASRQRGTMESVEDGNS